ncbi:MAG: hypothetical protein COB17_00640 [Sulfurimonas sp.]|nr:MAG: hypothetical protein COB17_00640 [Sulfurimonas sp.]
MIKIFLILSLAFSFSIADKYDNLVYDKIKTLINTTVYNENNAYIKIVFSPTNDYIRDEKVDSVKIIAMLKEHGLLNLFFKKPRELNLNFQTSGAPLFFVKIMSDTLRNIGYYRYVTKESNLEPSKFSWNISLNSEYATDPIILQRELLKSGCKIIDIYRNSPSDWTYIIDMNEAYLNTQKLKDGVEVKLKRSLYAYWLNVSDINKLKIKSSRRNNWYPYIAYYDKNLKLLQVVKRNTQRRIITLNIKGNTHYIKISDIYTLKNIKDSLVLEPTGVR